MNKDNEKWQILSSEYIIRRPWLTARRDSVKLPDGRVNPEYYVLEYPDFVNVIAVTVDGQMIMEHQYRHALGVFSLEICAGVMEKGETPLQAAQRELQEETGYAGGKWSEFITMAPNSSAMNNLCHCFLAVGVEQVSSQHLDATEDLEYFLMPTYQVYHLLKENKILQSMMAASLWKYFALYPEKCEPENL